MFVEKLEDLPESMHDQFEAYELDGKQGFQHKSTIALANSLKNAKAEKQQTASQLEALSSKLSEFEAKQEQAIEEARAKAMEEARSNKDVESIEKRYQEQMEDLRKRVAEETRNSTLQEVAEQRAAEKAETDAHKVGAELGVDSEAGELIAEILIAQGRIKYDPSTGKPIYHDAKGGALSIDRAEFLNELRKEKRFARLLKSSEVTQGGGMANGGNRGGAAVKQATRDEFQSWNPSKQKEFAKSGGTIV